ncbi:MAG: serine protease [Pseudomonadota bacterium]
MAKDVSGLLTEITKAATAYDAEGVEDASGRLAEHIIKTIASHPPGFVKELERAVSTFDRQQAEDLCNRLVDHLQSHSAPYPEAESVSLLNILRRKRYFDLIVTVADVLLQTGQDAPAVRRQYAQALLDLSHLSAGLVVLEDLERDCLANNDSDALDEIRGLKGRAKKQMYVDAAAGKRGAGKRLGQRLEEAIADYAHVFSANSDRIWHGVNLAALLDRAARDGLRLADGSLPDARKVANQVLQSVACKKTTNLWDQASAGEACLALGDYATALDWVLRYTEDNTKVDAFEYASTLRQFEEVWQLDESTKEQAQILHLLRAALLRKEGGRVQLDRPVENLASAAALEDDKQFEKVLGKDRYKTFRWYRTGLERALGVAHVRDRAGNGQGSGFLVRGTDLHESLGPDWVVVTNAHVISDDPTEQTGSPAALPPHEVRICFEAKDPNTEFDVEQILFSSPRTELDCTIVSLATPIEHSTPYPIARRLPLVGKNQRVYVIGHPRGGGLSYSIDDNLLLDHQAPKLHYRAPTEGGSSGSPVFNQQWDLVALHHAGGMKMRKLNGKPGTYPANEGLSFQSIKAAVAASLSQ